ncbi:CDP-diacylglycerol--serine O-phosphatidyltransferase [Rodentibacter pneumotropicus]|uniref:CDP-diacylglycerol--serine O-phosphatidyltransferase n=1 Tax=Rodentibacter pneumotropicus TaxID=758 RepID=A0A3S4U5C0_9PAST|nr:CDP-diacylglycerol--serine O-phosphatidyltransferase [Rodentibacter pneumotropicus]
MLINKLKRTEQNLKNLPFLPLEKAQVEFLFSPTEFKTQIIELIRNAKKRIYVTALYWQKDEAGQEILDEIYRIKQEQPDLDIKILVDWHRGQRNLLGAENLRPMPIGIRNSVKPTNFQKIRICFSVCLLIHVKCSVFCISRDLFR